MRSLSATLLALFCVICPCLASTDFSGSWAIDLKASTSPDALLKRLHIPFIQRRLAASIEMEAVYKQTPNMLVIVTRVPGFSRTEQLPFNGRRNLDRRNCPDRTHSRPVDRLMVPS